MQKFTESRVNNWITGRIRNKKKFQASKQQELMGQFLQENTVEMINSGQLLLVWLTVGTSGRLNLFGPSWITCLPILLGKGRDFDY